MAKAKRGFAAMDPDKQREIARKGGRSAHAAGNAHEFNVAEAAEAGRKGGKKISSDRKHMGAIGRMGGLARGRKIKDSGRETDEEKAT